MFTHPFLFFLPWAFRATPPETKSIQPVHYVIGHPPPPRKPSKTIWDLWLYCQNNLSDEAHFAWLDSYQRHLRHLAPERSIDGLSEADRIKLFAKAIAAMQRDGYTLEKAAERLLIAGFAFKKPPAAL